MSQQSGPLGSFGGDREGLLRVAERLLGRAQRHCSFRRLRKPVPSPGRERVGVGPLRRGSIRLDVVRRDHAGKLLIPDRLEVMRDGEMLPTAVALRERRVRDLADQALEERVLPSLR